jgi:hypothetical protein
MQSDDSSLPPTAT